MLGRSGWPSSCSFGGVFRSGTHIYAWATGPSWRQSERAKGGLYEWKDTSWSRVDSGLFGTKTILNAASSDDDGIVVVGSEGTAPFIQASSQLVVGIAPTGETRLLSTEESTTLLVTTVLPTATGWYWTTDFAEMWHADRSGFVQSTPAYRTCTALATLGTKFLIATEEFGVLMMDASSVITHVQDESREGSTAAVTTAPQPAQQGQFLSITISGCDGSHAAVEWASLFGAQLPVNGRPDTHGSVLHIDVPSLAPGVYAVHVRGEQCRHTCMVLVE